MTRIASLVSAADDIVSEDVEVPSWGVTLRIQGMSGRDRADYFTAVAQAREKDDEELIARLEIEVLINCLLDPEDNSPAFEMSDVDMLLTKSGGVIGMLSRKAMKASGLDADAEERLGKPSLVSKETRNDASTSTSPENSE